MSPGRRKRFWCWVAGRHAHGDPRSDLIRDTRNFLNPGVDPSITGAFWEVREEYHQLWERFIREHLRAEHGIVGQGE